MFATPQVHRAGGENYYVTHGEDKELYVEFSNEPVHMTAESAAQGRAVYKDVPHITILFPGDKTKKVFRPVRFSAEESQPYPPDPERFPRQWAAFKANEEQHGDGMPLAQWPPVNKSQVLEFKSLNIHTVEQLAALSDAAVQSLGPGGRDLRKLAQGWLKQAEGGKEVARLTAELSKRDDQINALQAQLNALGEQLNKLSEKGTK